MYVSTIYSAIRSLVKYIKNNSDGKVELLELDVKYPIDDNEYLTQLENIIKSEKVKKDSRIKLAVIDAISSVPGSIVPYQRIINLLREHNILSVIDGAHSIGQIPLNLHEINPDFFVTNCHKWLYSVRGSAILYVPFRNKELVHHAITSTWYDYGFPNEFLWTGTQDFR